MYRRVHLKELIALRLCSSLFRQASQQQQHQQQEEQLRCLWTPAWWPPSALHMDLLGTDEKNKLLFIAVDLFRVFLVLTVSFFRLILLLVLSLLVFPLFFDIWVNWLLSLYAYGCFGCRWRHEPDAFWSFFLFLWGQPPMFQSLPPSDVFQTWCNTFPILSGMFCVLSCHMRSSFCT